ncbi:hypothetical protein E6W36_06440 [Hankyongella ginsenosidimutans]|uniref:Uncharacterized protein n=1 Tax=Hankyongella ginsenosidimutans TaxID=1763828 RepID=A0A4D7CBX5_9SPHN|nr:hypothetical protein [Hankyongella ginsenosidimutans]QCI79322.1 hypothetical protein E6W36_06440 [Hankyongella ginsenosidimutans]TXG82802.1 MAG: hypothetical protein E6R12_10310 [Sphingomonadales bacterium]
MKRRHDSRRSLGTSLHVAGWALLLLSPLIAWTELVGDPEPGQAAAAFGVGLIYVLIGPRIAHRVRR